VTGTIYGPSRQPGAVRCTQQCRFHNICLYLIKTSEPTSDIVGVETVEKSDIGIYVILTVFILYELQAGVPQSFVHGKKTHKIIIHIQRKA